MEYVSDSTVTLRAPKTVATITICGSLKFTITDMMSFKEPTPEQIKNLHDMFCIDVELIDA